MKHSRKQAKTRRVVSSVFLMLTLIWLTVSLPFISQSREGAGCAATAFNFAGDCEDETEKSIPNTAEEKTPNNANPLSEEYLHSAHPFEPHPDLLSKQYRPEASEIYLTFHGELISPPPDCRLSA